MFHPFAARRARLAAERTIERDHQLALVDRLVHLVESLGDSQIAAAEKTSTALIAIAKANEAQANQFAAWLDSFKVTTAPTSSTVTDEDEWRKEQARLAVELGLPLESAEHIPEEFRLALALRGNEFVGDLSRD